MIGLIYVSAIIILFIIVVMLTKEEVKVQRRGISVG